MQPIGWLLLGHIFQLWVRGGQMCEVKAAIQQLPQDSLNQVFLAVASQMHHDPQASPHLTFECVL